MGSLRELYKKRRSNNGTLLETSAYELCNNCCFGVGKLPSRIVKYIRAVCLGKTVIDMIIDFASLPEQPSGFGCL